MRHPDRNRRRNTASERRGRRYDIGRCHAEPSAAGGKQRVPSVAGTLPGERARHRLLRADVVSSSSAISVGGLDLAYRQVIERAGGGMQSVFGDMQVTGGGFEIAMAEQQLNGAQIGARVKQVGGEGVTHHE
jgi:hypothetical protein